MWLPALTTAVAQAAVDVAITCGLLPESDGVVSEVFCAEPLLVGLRPSHRLAHQHTVALTDLAADVLGTPDDNLFPAWALSQRQALAEADVSPSTVLLDAQDLAAAHWTEQIQVDWVLLIGSLTATHAQTAVRPVNPPTVVPYTLQWNPDRATTAAIAKIEAKNRYYAFDICPGFWSWLETCHAKGHLYSTIKVRDELLKGEDDLTEWIKNRPVGFFVNSTGETAPYLRALARWANASTHYTSAAKAEFLNSADYYLVAQARETGFALVTHEISSQAKKRIKIPEAAAQLGVRILSPYDVIRSEGASFR